MRVFDSRGGELKTAGMDSPHTMKKKAIGPQMGRRAVLTGAGAAALAGVVMQVGSSEAAAAQGADKQQPARGSGFAAFEWLGNAGWRISTPTTTLLLDPYLSRFDTGLAAGAFNETTPLTLDPSAITSALGSPGDGRPAVSAILVTHTHWDHFADVPHIAATWKSTVYTTLTGYQLGIAMGLPSTQLAVVKGGEELNIGDAVVRVVRSLHSRNGAGGLTFPGVRMNVPPPPATIADLLEGDTIGFVIRPGVGQPGVLLLGGSDYDDHELQGLDVDTVALPVPSNGFTADYAGRLLRALDKPGTIILVHWDDFESPLRTPPKTDDKTRGRMAALTADIKRISPRTRVVEPTYLTPMQLL